MRPTVLAVLVGLALAPAPLLAQAARLAADVIEEDVRARRNMTAISRLKRLVVRDGPAPSVKYEAGVLVITVTPKMGVAGRPSSERIRRALF